MPAGILSAREWEVNLQYLLARANYIAARKRIIAWLLLQAWLVWSGEMLTLPISDAEHNWE
jgi:hypothetical protein